MELLMDFILFSSFSKTHGAFTLRNSILPHLADWKDVTSEKKGEIFLLDISTMIFVKPPFLLLTSQLWGMEKWELAGMLFLCPSCQLHTEQPRIMVQEHSPQARCE